EAGRAPLVLFDERARIAAPTGVALPEQVELRHERLDQSDDRDRMIESGRHVADAHLDGVEEMVRADVPPDLLSVVDTAGLHEGLHEVLERGLAVELVRNSRSWKPLEDLRSRRHEAGAASEPERR